MLLKLFAGGKSVLPLACLVSVSVASPFIFAQSRANTVSPALQRASNLGPIDSTQDITLTVYVTSRNQAAFDQAVDKLYDPSSPTYHQWMIDAELAQYAPAAADLKAVKQELVKQGLSVISSDAYSIRVHGPAANVQTAFQTKLENFSLNGKTFRAHTQDAQLTGSAGALVSSVVGLDETTVKPMYKRVTDPKTGISKPPVALSKVLASGGLSSLITNNCLQPPAVETYTTPGSQLPIGVYFGNIYNPVDANGNPLVCDFTAAQLESHYGLNAAYSAGLTGAGQTIVLLEGYGYPTMLSDANAFSQLMGLPALNSSNFSVVYPEGPPPANLGVITGWNFEIALDIQWAHAMAPGAKILVVATYGQDSQDFQTSMNYIIANKLGTVVSDSWGEDVDLLAGPSEQNAFNSILKTAAAKGISFQFSSGDSGDNGVGAPQGAPSVPANSPYVTAVGGTSILNNPNGPGFVEVGWGSDWTFISLGSVLDPPEPDGFLFGAGGGESVFFSKPAWQSSLPGTGRQVPDISALSDPYTGVPVVLTTAGTQYVYVGVGGTSLASPIVTGILAIATQKAGHALGQAAPLIAALPSTAITDILPLTSPTNLSGTVVDSSGPTFYSPSLLFQPFLGTTQGFISADYLDGPGFGIAFAFGMDTSLTVTTGWDNITGFGVPNGLPFIKAMAK